MTEAEQSGRSRDTPGVIAPPPVIYLASLGLGFALEALLPGADLPGWAQWIGGAIIVVGVVLSSLSSEPSSGPAPM